MSPDRIPPTLREVMTEEVVTVGPETTLRDAVEALRDAGVSGLPVVAGGKVVGVVSARDILEFEADAPGVPTEQPTQVEWGGLEEEPDEWEEDEEPPAGFFTGMWPDVGADVLERFQEVGAPEWDLLEEHVVAEVMTQRIRAMGPDREVADAAARMLEAGIHRVLVMEGERLLGIVSTMDIVRAVAERRI